MAVNMFTPTKDEFRELPDGRQIQIAFKGVPMEEARADELGLTGSDETTRHEFVNPVIETPVGNTVLTQTAEENEILSNDPRLEESIAEVEKVQSENQPQIVMATPKSTKSTKGKAPAENK